MSIVINDQEFVTPENLVVKNFLDPSVYRFKNKVVASRVVTEIIVHETVTRSWQDTVSVLKSRNLGVHFIADADGTIYQHADLMTDEMWHASQHNGISVGIEIVNPYEPALVPHSGVNPWKECPVIDAAWSASQHPPKKYQVPPMAQMEAVTALINWLTSYEAGPLTIPQSWPGLSQHESNYQLALYRVAKCATPPVLGILAHMYFGHGDGAWPVLYSWLRLEANLEPAAAYAEAQRRAQLGYSADLTEYFDQNPYLTV